MHDAVLERAKPAPKPLYPPGALAPLAKKPVWAVAGVLAVVHLLASPFNGYWIDEVYMLAAGTYHLDWGYVDQPPIAPLLAAAMGWIAPGSLIALRLPAILISASGVFLAALLARELGGDRRAQVLAAGATATGLWTTLAGHWITPYTLEPPLWMLLCWLLIRWIRLHNTGNADDRLLLILGAVAGIAAETKFQIFLLGAALLLSVLAFGPREILRRPMLWAGIGIAALIAAPTLIWQAAHGWPQLQMGAVVASESPLLSGGRSGTAIAMVLYAGVVGGTFFVVGLWRLLFAKELRSYRFLGVTTVLLYIFVIATAGRPYYLTGMYGVLSAAAVVGLQRRREAKPSRRRWGWLAWPAFALSVLAAGGVFYVSSGIAAAFGLPDTESIARDTAAVYRELPAQTREHTAIIGDSYVISAYIDAYSPKYGIPTSYSPHRGYGYFDPPREQAQSAIFYGKDPSLLRPYFSDVRLVRGDGERTIWLCTGKRLPWTTFWPTIRNL